MASGKARNRATVVVLAVLVVVLALGAAGAVGFLVWQQQSAAAALREAKEAPLPAAEPLYEPEEDSLPLNPIDFEELRQENPDLYAWVYVPNTNVNLPVARREGDDLFYLDHDRHGAYDAAGTVFSQAANTADFSDPVTVLYGHNMANGAMFATLHDFSDPAFFAENELFYVYVPGHILTYRVVAAFNYDDRHILYSFGFADAAVREGYFASVLAPEDPQANVREGVVLDADSRIVQLSTCRSAYADDPVRYLVTGVLVDDQPTT